MNVTNCLSVAITMWSSGKLYMALNQTDPRAKLFSLANCVCIANPIIYYDVTCGSFQFCAIKGAQDVTYQYTCRA